MTTFQPSKSVSETEEQKVERGRAGSRGGRATVPKMAEAKPAGKGEMLDDPHFGPRLHSLKSTLASPPPHMPPRLEVGDRLGGVAWPLPSGDLHTSPPPPTSSQSLSSLSRLRSRNHQPNLPPFTSDTLSNDSSADSGACGVRWRGRSRSPSVALPTTVLPTVSGGGNRLGSCAAERMAWGGDGRERARRGWVEREQREPAAPFSRDERVAATLARVTNSALTCW